MSSQTLTLLSLLLFVSSAVTQEPNVTLVAQLAARSLSADNRVFSVDQISESRVSSSKLELTALFSGNGVSLESLIRF